MTTATRTLIMWNEHEVRVTYCASEEEADEALETGRGWLHDCTDEKEDARWQIIPGRLAVQVNDYVPNTEDDDS